MTKPGDDLPRIDVLPNVPHGMVAVREDVHAEEAMIVHGLLVSNDIPAALVAASAGLHTYTRQIPAAMGVYVEAERLEEALALVSELGEDFTVE